MNTKPIQLQSELQCRATAELHTDIKDDLKKPDSSLAKLLKKDQEEDEVQDPKSGSD
jgi:hypothetical protein